MQNLLLDTNIYGEMLVDLELDKVKERISKNKSLLVLFGLIIIRKELRATSKKVKVEGSNLRIDLLNLYDSITGRRTLEITEEMESLASNYFHAYQKFGGAKGHSEMFNDLLIVAGASIKNMDIVVSNDDASMKSEHAISAYELVNSISKLRIPKFISYEEFKGLLG
jgi:hypothetical protein